MQRIENKFKTLQQSNKKALITFVTAGDPTPASTVSIMHTLVEGGADVLELGYPFSDPMADGPAIQRASERALKNGVSLRQVFQFISEFRKTDQQTPVVLMGYANPVEAIGYQAFADLCKSSGVDGVLIVDYPPEESKDLVKYLYAVNVDPIYLLAPTTSETRISEIAKLVRGYAYYVSLRGVTGASHIDVDEVKQKLAMIKKFIQLPIGVGFGIRDAKTAKLISGFADAVVVGTRLIEEIENSKPDQLTNNLLKLMQGIRTAMDQ